MKDKSNHALMESPITSDSLMLGGDWITEQRKYVVRELESVLRNKPNADEKRIAEDMLSFYRDFGAADSSYRFEDLTADILPGFVPVREVR